MALTEICKQQRDIANALFSDAECVCTEQQRTGFETPSCIQAEEDRPLTTAEKKRDWHRRPFWAYETARMCNSCAAYFHAERAAQILHEMHCNVVRCQARQKTTA